jgi:hypothetical protein
MARVAVARRNEGLDTFIGNCNGGLLRLYTGTRPTDSDTALSGNTLLATLTLNATSFGAASAGVLTANAITSDSSADATGTATWARLWESDGTTPVMDLSLGTSGTEVIVTTTSIVATAVVSCSACTVTWGVGT